MLTVDVSPESAGVVKFYDNSPPNIYPVYYFLPASEVVIEAIPAPGYQFDGWTGGVTSEENPFILVLDCTKTVTANFSLHEYALFMEVDGNGSTNPSIGPHNYVAGSTVNIVAIPDSGWRFDGWQGDVADHDLVATTVSLDSSKTVTADFSQILNTLTIGVDGLGSTEPEIGLHQYPQGSVVDIIAIPDSGWRFDSWMGHVANPTSSTTQIIVTADMAVSAHFKRSSLIWWLIGGVAVSVVAIGVLVLIVNQRLRA